jgi:8-oxo-dGTP pyrophosphatase MutT (NUDIX family)
MIAWTETPEGWRYWLQRRAKSMSVHSGKLDMVASGSLTAGELPTDGMVREAHEETSIPRDFSRANMKASGAATFHSTRNSDKRAGSQPQIRYTYELELPADIVPTPLDNEAEEFIAMSVDEVSEELFRHNFKECDLDGSFYSSRRQTMTSTLSNSA